MEVFNFILIIVFLIISAFGFFASIDRSKSDFSNFEMCKIIFFLILMVSCSISVLNGAFELRKKSDVFEGKAEYVETIHISNGDTIRTYNIQPKENK